MGARIKRHTEAPDALITVISRLDWRLSSPAIAPTSTVSGSVSSSQRAADAATANTAMPGPPMRESASKREVESTLDQVGSIAGDFDPFEATL